MKTLFKSLLLIAFLLLAIISDANASTNEFENYLNKVIEKPNYKDYVFFEDLDFSHDKSIQKWLGQLDLKLDTDLIGSLEASFFLTLDKDGSITSLEIEDINEAETSFYEFKSFITKLLLNKMPRLPKQIDKNTIFYLDASMLYIERKEALINNNQANSFLPKAKALLKANLAKLDSLKLELTSPNYIDDPALGEYYTFYSKELDAYLSARVVDYSRKSVNLYAEYIVSRKDKSEQVVLNTVFEVPTYQLSNSSIAKNIYVSGFASAFKASLSSAIVSNGILPGSFALIGILGSALQEYEHKPSINMSEGDSVIVSFSDKKEGEQK